MSAIIETIYNYNSIRDADIKTMELRDMYTQFGRILVLCLSNTKIQCEKISLTNYTIIPMPITIIKNTFMKDLLLLLSYDYLQEHFQIDRKYFTCSDQKELVLNLSSMSEQTMRSFLLQFNGVTTFQDYIVATLINDYMTYTNISESTRINRLNILQTINERTYWSLSSNCKLNISLQFIHRGFNLLTSSELENNINNIIGKISLNNPEDNNYLNHIYRKQIYVDASSNLNHLGYKLYRITHNLLYDTMTMKTFNKFLEENGYMNDREIYYLVMNLLSSKELCHYIINNKYILNKLKQNSSFYSKYYHIFKYYLSYAWLTFYLEESITKRNIKKTDRFIFDIETACLLPETPSYSNNIVQNSAYLPVLVSEELYNLNENVMGVMPINNYNIRYGICELELCKYRINLFISGKHNCNLFENINWDNIAVTGSIMACCLPNFNPLMLNFMTRENIISESPLFLKYINEYYRDSDIDILCNLKGTDFIDKVHSIANTIEDNIRLKCNPDIKDILIIKKIIKTVAIIINSEFIKKYIVNTSLTYEEIMQNINDIKIKEKIYPLYLENMFKKNKIFMENPANSNIWSNNKYSPEFDIVSIDQLQIIFAKTKKDKLDDIKNIINKQEQEQEQEQGQEQEQEQGQEQEHKQEHKQEQEQGQDDSLINEFNILFLIKENLKYQIISQFLPHSIELFKIRYDDYFATIALFHLPIVRSYYNGKTIRMTPSCISACSTLINIDYKYFAGSKDPIEIINKYRIRGFGTILNDKEKIRFLEYNNLVPKWKKIYNLDINNLNSVKICLGFKLPSDNIFKYSKTYYNENTLYNLINTEYHNNDLYYLIQSKYNTIPDNIIQKLKLESINKSGYVNIMKHFIIDMAYNLYN